MIVVHFLIPVADRAGKPYRRSIYHRLHKELQERFGGFTRLGARDTGSWRNPESGELEFDESFRYEVGVERELLDELDAYLGDVAYRIGQKGIWRVVLGQGKVIEPRPGKEHE